MVDSIGSGGGPDAAYQRQKKALEEERARDLERIEKRNIAERERLQEQREREISKLQAEQLSDIEDRRVAAQQAVDRSQAYANQRIRDFQVESDKLADEAKRQYQEKATQLQRAASDLNQQRAYMEKQHSDQMKKTQEAHEQREALQKNKLDRDAAEIHARQQNRITEEKGRGEAEFIKLRQDLEDEKRTLRAQTQFDLQNLAYERDETKGSMQSNIDKIKRQGAETANYELYQQAQQREKREYEFGRQMDDVEIENRANINRAHFRGQRKLAETSDFYEQATDQVKKDASKKIKNTEIQSTLVLSALENDAKAQEAIARKGYEERKKMFAGQREKNLADSAKQNEALKAELRSQYENKAKEQDQLQQTRLAAQRTQQDQEIKFQKDFGDKQVVETSLKSAKKVAAHEQKQKDAFYNVQQLQPRIDSSESEYKVTVAVPEHEQESVRLTHQGNALTLSGTRRSENRVKTEKGHTQTTHSYQSYTETFPVKGKLLMADMTKEYKDGTLIFKIPKG